MNRKCLILGYPGERRESNYCRGVFRDIENYKSFLESPLGGAWDPSEITTATDIGRAEVMTYLRTIKHDDYFMFIFCGHGYYDEDLSQTMIQINGKETLGENYVRGNYCAKLAIFDCCRVSKEKMKNDEALMEVATAKAQATLSSSECRKYYDEQIVKCSKSIVRAYACSIDQKSGDSSEFGGYYSHSLIKSCRKILKESEIDLARKYRVISIAEAHELAIDMVDELSEGAQLPQIRKPRQEIQLPFAVLA